MAAGDLITTNYQYEYNGLLLGSGTPYIMEKVTGLLTTADVIDNHYKAQSRQGKILGQESFDARHVQFDVSIDGTSGSDAEDKIAALMNAFVMPPYFSGLSVIDLVADDYAAFSSTPSNPDKFFVFQRPNKGKRAFYGHVNKVSFDSTGDVAQGLAKGSVDLLCIDPLCYSIGPLNHLVSGTIANTATSGSVTCTNAGNFPTQRLRISLVGPMTNPVITNGTTGRAMKFTGTLPTSSDTLVVMVHGREIWVNDVPDTSYRRSDFQWFDLQPGGNTIQVTRSVSAAAAPFTVQFQDAWMTG